LAFCVFVIDAEIYRVGRFGVDTGVSVSYECILDIAVP